MNFFGCVRLFSCIGVFALFLTLSACGSDSGSGSSEEGLSVSSATENSSSAEESSGSTENPNSSAGTSSGSSAKSSASETASSDEALNEAQKVIKGTCSPSVSSISKGELVTWNFYRAEGDLYSQILAPFVWTFEGAATTNVQGNGMQTATVRYNDPGSYVAYLNVDGNDVTCESVQVQGIPIVVNSCKAQVATAKVGENITWTVDAESESNITNYTWASTYGPITGTDNSGSLTATTAMHKQSVNATVTISNADNSVIKYTCDGVNVIDPSIADLTLELGDVNDSKYAESKRSSLPDSIFIPAQEPVTVAIPAGAPTNCNIGCVPRVGADYMSLKITVDEVAVDNLGYFSPSGCMAGKKYVFTATVTTLCVVKSGN